MFAVYLLCVYLSRLSVCVCVCLPHTPLSPASLLLIYDLWSIVRSLHTIRVAERLVAGKTQSPETHPASRRVSIKIFRIAIFAIGLILYQYQLIIII